MNAVPSKTAALVVGIGGTTSAESSTERALSLSLQAAELAGARTLHFGGAFLSGLPHYGGGEGRLTPDQARLVATVREADALILATPSYHGGISGLVKSALDTLEETRHDRRPYFDGRAVGCIVTSHGAQAGGVVLTSLRAIVHALRGWPTPYGLTINVLECPLHAAVTQAVAVGLATVAQQVTDSTRGQAALPAT